MTRSPRTNRQPTPPAAPLVGTWITPPATISVSSDAVRPQQPTPVAQPAPPPPGDDLGPVDPWQGDEIDPDTSTEEDDEAAPTEPLDREFPFGPEFPVITVVQLFDLIAEARFHGSPYTVTPEVAEYILTNHNNNNRNEKKRNIEKYKRDMRMRRWIGKSGMTISFNVLGELDNGQNRLKACVKARTPFPIMIVFGTDRDAFYATDVGVKRSPADTMTHQGIANASMVAAAASLLMRYNRDRLKSPHFDPTNAEIAVARALYPEMDTVVYSVNNLRHRIDVMPGPMLFVATLLYRKDPAAWMSFAERLGTGAGLEQHHPILTLRDQLRRHHKGETYYKRTGRDIQKMQSAFIIKSWNAYRRGQPIKELRFLPDERFPDVV